MQLPMFSGSTPQNRKRASVKQLQSLCGKLNWACQMVKGGKTLVRRLIDSLSNVNNRNADSS
jgi:hypothetical protein